MCRDYVDDKEGKAKSKYRGMRLTFVAVDVFGDGS